MKAWKPYNLVCDDEDEYFEPLAREDRVLAAKITLIIRLAMLRAKNKEAPHVGPSFVPMCRCMIRPITPDE